MYELSNGILPCARILEQSMGARNRVGIGLLYGDSIFKQGVDSDESVPPAYVSWRAGTTTLFLPGS